MKNLFNCESEYRRINDIIVHYKGSLVLELQQRAIEFSSIVDRHQNIRYLSALPYHEVYCFFDIFPLDVVFDWIHMIRSALVERMPVLDEATYSGRRAGSVPAVVSTSQAAPLNLPNGVAKTSAAPLIDLLDLSSDDVPAPNSSGGDFLQDLLGVDLAPASSQSGDIIHFCILLLAINYCLPLLGSDKEKLKSAKFY